MKNIFLFSILTLSATALAVPDSQWLTVDNQVLAKIQPKLNKSVQTLFTAQSASIVQLPTSEIEKLSALIHEDLHRCGGFITHDSFEEAKNALDSQGDSYFAQRALFADYTLDQANLINPMMKEVSESLIRETIIKLSSFHNRYYKSDTGVKSSEYIRDMWAALAKNRSDVKVELFKHKNWPQASIIMTIEGSEKANEIVILGGHADSIGSMVFGKKAEAPGADDNASGIATITEVIRILMAQDFKPKRTIQFMGYAAEEVGLLGSKDVVASYKSKAKQVIGVIQFDMTLFKGTADKDIVMISDFTNGAQNEFLAKLIDEYVKAPWGYSKCGYGCSDHASWTAAGYPSSMPFESNMNDINHKIHTADDTLQTAGGDAKHAVKFAKLGAAFVVELAN